MHNLIKRNEIYCILNTFSNDLRERNLSVRLKTIGFWIETMGRFSIENPESPLRIKLNFHLLILRNDVVIEMEHLSVSKNRKPDSGRKYEKCQLGRTTKI